MQFKLFQTIRPLDSNFSFLNFREKLIIQRVQFQNSTT